MTHICDIFMQIKVIAVNVWRKSGIFLISTYKYGKTRTKFANQKTPSCSAHHASPIFVKNCKGYSTKFFFR